jgi:hypothetical protein
VPHAEPRRDLPPAVAHLLRSDPDVPGLALLLDDAALATWLQARLGRPLVGVRRRYLRWKPGAGGVARVDLGPGAGEAFLAVWHRDAAAKLAKTVQRGGRAVLAVDEQALAVLARPSADRDLPGLARLQARGAAGVARRLDATDDSAHRLLRHVGTGARTLAWKPQRRWVGLLAGPQPRGHHGVVLRAYRPGAAEGAAAAYRSVHEAVGDSAPRLLGTDLRHGLLAVEHVPGRTLDAWPATLAGAGAGGGAGDGPRPGPVVRAGVLLAELHTAGPLPAGRTDGPVARSAQGPGLLDVDEECRRVRDAAGLLALLVPGSGVENLVDEVGAALHRLPASTPVLLHGDFSADQVVVRPDGGPALLDLDEACWGPAAYDLAGAAAAWWVAGGTGALALVGQLQEGYRRLAPLPSLEQLRVRTAAHLLRRAAEPFRTGRPDWPARVRAAVDEARALLRSGTSAVAS